MHVDLTGHTRGHTGYYLPGHQALIVGDAIVTVDTTSRLSGSQLLPTVFHGSTRTAISGVDDIAASQAQLLIPRHGLLIEMTAFHGANEARQTAQPPRLPEGRSSEGVRQLRGRPCRRSSRVASQMYTSVLVTERGREP